MERRRFLKVIATASTSGLLVSCAREEMKVADGFVEEEEYEPLLSAAQATSRSFGTAVNRRMLAKDGIGYQTVLTQCASVTAEWSFKWNWIAPTAYEYNFSDADGIADFARRHGKRMRGHTLLWHKGMPSWAEALLAETREWNYVRTYFETVMPRYSDIVDEWDVVNEPIEIGHRGDGLRANQFLQAFGPDYIDWAFWTAREVAPHAKLFLNEYGLEYRSSIEGQRRLSLLKLVEGLLARGVPIDGVGLQAHLDLRKGTIYADGIYGLMRDLSGFGLELAVTELDVREEDRDLPVARRDQKVADEVHRYLDVVLDFDALHSITTWGLSDGNSWLAYNEEARADNRGLPYDREWRRKPMRTAIIAAFRGARPIS